MPDQNAAKIKGDHNKRTVLWKESYSKEAVDRQLCGAAHKGCQKDRHLTVTLGRKRTACHDTGDGTAKPYQHWYDAPAGKPDLPQELIHDKGNSCHITAVFQKRKEEKQGDDDRQEA